MRTGDPYVPSRSDSDPKIATVGLVTDLPAIDLPHVHSGKVRDIYDAGDGNLLMVTSDRLSAFDVVLAEPIPHKGSVLTAMTAFWVDQLGDVIGNHLLSTDLGNCPPEAQHPELAGRVMLCRRAEMLPVECIVRGRLTGSAWKEYKAEGTMHGEALPTGLQESAELPSPVFTPSTKADVGLHDENITYDRAVEMVGAEVAGRARDASLELFSRAARWASERGIVIADTKFELGLVDGELILCDEVLTPDSSRFWPAADVVLGATPPSFDKQPVRDYLDGLDWDKAPPPPPLPVEVVATTSARYIDAYERITGRSFADWPGAGN